ncbi:SERTA domain-containing protein 3 isoform X1 [Sorex araneus]|uniref:SERTA domain-containing protein 3 isoform X1 n=2 Tax=Sorex araneus TaxID=42254 RepID=UPI002433C33E|nr:SERTA domain-containing protein 3 isoform X1 [Sorex araneus]
MFQEALIPNLAAKGVMVGGLKRKHSDVEEEEDEKWDWSPAGLRSYQQALLRISLDKVQRSLGPRAPSLRRHVLIHNTLQQLQAALCLAPTPALPPEPLFLGEEDFSLSSTIGSILRELDTTMDESEPPQNPVAPPAPQNEVPQHQPDPVFLEALSSRYLEDSSLDDFFLDIDTSTVEKEPALAPPEPPHNLFCTPGSWEWNELDHIMEIILGS